MPNDKVTSGIYNRAASKGFVPGREKLSPDNDMTNFDKEFILERANHESQILDLGSGSGLIVNKIEPYVGKIVCVELFEEFSKFIKKSSKVEVINTNLLDFKIDQQFDMVTAFGVMHHFDEDEAAEIYKNCFSMLKEGGAFIVKNQFGISEKVIVDGFSKALGEDYYGNYRLTIEEVQMLKQVGFDKVERHDIYPAEYNRGDNTHFYALVAHKRMR